MDMDLWFISRLVSPVAEILQKQTLNSQSCAFALPSYIVSPFFFIVYHSQDDSIIMFDRIAEKIDDIHSDHSLAIIHICGVFNIHHKN